MRSYLSFLLFPAFVYGTDLNHSVDKGRDSIWERVGRSFQTDFSEPIELKVDKITSSQSIPRTADLVRWSPHPPIGLVNMEWQWEESGIPHKTFGTASVRAFAKLAVSRVAIRHGEALTPQKISFEKRELGPYVASGYFADPAHFYPKIAYGFIHPGTVLSASNTQTPYAISRGEVVQLTSQQGPLEVTAQVTALKEGHEGEWISVQNTATRKVLQARVVGPGKLATH